MPGYSALLMLKMPKWGHAPDSLFISELKWSVINSLGNQDNAEGHRRQTNIVRYN